MFCHETKSNVHCWPSTRPIRSSNSIYRSSSKTLLARSAIKGVTQPSSEKETKEDILKAKTSMQVPSFYRGTVRVRLEHCRGSSKAQMAASLPSYDFSLWEVAGKMSGLNILWPAPCQVILLQMEHKTHLKVCKKELHKTQTTGHQAHQLLNGRGVVTAGSEGTLKRAWVTSGQPNSNGPWEVAE